VANSGALLVALSPPTARSGVADCVSGLSVLAPFTTLSLSSSNAARHLREEVLRGQSHRRTCKAHSHNISSEGLGNSSWMCGYILAGIRAVAAVYTT
jgi:hypothetical protein